MMSVDAIMGELRSVPEEIMTTASTIWLNRLLARVAEAAVRAMPTDRKPMEIEVQRLPDYVWRDLGFPPARRPGGE